MTPVFAGTSCYVAAMNPIEARHRAAVITSAARHSAVVPAKHVLVEVGNRRTFETANMALPAGFITQPGVLPSPGSGNVPASRFDKLQSMIYKYLRIFPTKSARRRHRGETERWQMAYVIRKPAVRSSCGCRWIRTRRCGFAWLRRIRRSRSGSRRLSSGNWGCGASRRGREGACGVGRESLPQREAPAKGWMRPGPSC